MGQIDLPPIGQCRGHHQLHGGIPADAPPGVYRLAIGLYEPPNGPRLPLSAAAALDPAIDGPDALMLDEIEVK